MLPEALTTLASTGATALVTVMVTDSWESLRAKFARLLGRGDTSTEADALVRLDESRATLTSAITAGYLEKVSSELQATWRVSLEHLLENSPEVVDELSALVAEAQDARTVAGRVEVHATATGQSQQAVLGQGTQNVAFGGQHGTSGNR
jgi:hypothetical protein